MTLALLRALLLLVISLLLVARFHRHALAAGRRRVARLVWRLRPRTPTDCTLRRLAAGPPQCGAAPPVVGPWRRGRSRRGAPQRIATEGYACRHPGCLYYGITDARIHALVADGHHGRSDRIRRFSCQACHHTVSARWGTALYQLKTPPWRVGDVLSALAEGLDVGAAVRVFGHGEDTITRWRDRAAHQADRVHRHFLHDLFLPHVQLDEIWVRVRLRSRVTWFWLALDPRTKSGFRTVITPSGLAGQ